MRLADEPMLKFVTVERDMPRKRAADLRGEDFSEIYSEYSDQKAAEQHFAIADRWVDS